MAILKEKSMPEDQDLHFFWLEYCKSADCERAWGYGRSARGHISISAEDAAELMSGWACCNGRWYCPEHADELRRFFAQ
jgi:hypothetical protein